jgi:thymidine phosphorylase
MTAAAASAAVEPHDAVDVIRAKRDGGEVPEDALRWMVDAYTRGYVADSQMAAFAMAVLLNGMTRTEIRVMTDAMIASGERMSFAGLGKADGRQALHRRRGRQDHPASRAPGRRVSA